MTGWKNTPEQQRVVDAIKAEDGARGFQGQRDRRPNAETRELGEQAAKFAAETGASFYDAALKFGLAVRTVEGYFVKRYPNASLAGRYRKGAGK